MVVNQLQLNKIQIDDFQKLIIDWYNVNSRRFPWRKKSISNYKKIIVEILLQRTRAETVSAFFPAFICTFPNWTTLAKATESDLQHFLKPIGLWRRRALSLSSLAQEMSKRQGHFPRTRVEIETLPSVGQYIANAILLFCHGEPQPLLDAGMARVLERVFCVRKMADIRYDPYLQQLAKKVVTCSDAIRMNWAILDLASLVCKPRDPKCPTCPLRDVCRYAKLLAEM
jgi:A/G-specific adenine glycosylase